MKVSILSSGLLLATSMAAMQKQGPATVTRCTTFDVLSSTSPAQELYTAAREGNTSCVRQLLRLGIENDIDKKALELAVNDGNKDAVSLLLENGAATDNGDRNRQRRVRKIVIGYWKRFGSHS